MLIIPPPIRSRKRPEGARPAAQAPVINVNVTRIFLTYEQGIVMLFDGPVTVDQSSPPTTWSFHGITSIQPGSGFNFTNGTYFLLNGVVVPGQSVVIAADDPAARTPSGGYVNGGTFTIEDL
jgi:hypothetical protein